MDVKMPVGLRPLLVPIDSLTQHPENPNNGDVDTVRELILTHGYTEPIIVQEATGIIEAGHTRVAAMLSLGQTHIPAVFVDHDDEGAVRYLVGDNEASRKAVMDTAHLLKVLDRLRETEQGLIGTGFNESEVDILRARQVQDEGPGGGWSEQQHGAVGIYQVIIEVDNSEAMHDLAHDLRETYPDYFIRESEL